MFVTISSPINYRHLHLMQRVSHAAKRLSVGHLIRGNRNRSGREGNLARATLELLSEEEQLDLVVDGEHTSTGDTTEDVGTGTLEE